MNTCPCDTSVLDCGGARAVWTALAVQEVPVTERVGVTQCGDVKGRTRACQARKQICPGE